MLYQFLFIKNDENSKWQIQYGGKYAIYEALFQPNDLKLLMTLLCRIEWLLRFEVFRCEVSLLLSAILLTVFLRWN